MTRYKLTCIETNARHTKFNVFDFHGVNCGTICVLTEDVQTFLQQNWKGDIYWNNKIPEHLLK